MAENVTCESHPGVHRENAQCLYPHAQAPPGAFPPVGHPLKPTDRDRLGLAGGSL